MALKSAISSSNSSSSRYSWDLSANSSCCLLVFIRQLLIIIIAWFLQILYLSEYKLHELIASFDSTTFKLYFDDYQIIKHKKLMNTKHDHPLSNYSSPINTPDPHTCKSCPPICSQPRRTCLPSPTLISAFFLTVYCSPVSLSQSILSFAAITPSHLIGCALSSILSSRPGLTLTFELGLSKIRAALSLFLTLISVFSIQKLIVQSQFLSKMYPLKIFVFPLWPSLLEPQNSFF
jgi:hypothetical protein